MRFGSYIYRKSFYHKMDARAKLLFSLMLSITFILSSNLVKSATLAFLMVLLSLFSVGVKESVSNFKKIALLSFFIIIFSPLQGRDGSPLINIGSFMLLSHEGLNSALSVLFKFIGISFLFSLLLETERVENIIASLRWFHLPYSFAITFSMTLSFIPYLTRRYEEIKEAIDLRMSENRKRESLMAVLTSLIVSAIKMIPESASALEERGFTGKIKNGFRVLNNNFFIFTQMALSVIIPITLIFWR